MNLIEVCVCVCARYMYMHLVQDAIRVMYICSRTMYKRTHLFFHKFILINDA